ncbi:DUF427-domain-containing protein [Periconia macrospinosa]|uniref:DUF427-domain-containing protein n=1 Tax=Periconia macrospinosa TaxID=97972 RepID=A0A2V1E420_9PLEO|nr:DUF427-domain-containing protein [Periconia macrospinosa]
MAKVEDLVKLAQKLSSEGLHKYEQTPRRVRGLLNGKYVFDTISAFQVWEHRFYPQYYIPVSSLTPSAKLSQSTPVEGTNNTIHLATLTTTSPSPNNTTPHVLIFNTPHLPEQLLKIPAPSLDQWFEEDTPIYSSHPKDPYKRIDILPSSRRITISLNGVVLADTSNPVLLLETGLRVRYYLLPTSVNWEVLRKSDTKTFCPYKGMAEYYHVELENGKVERDAVWYYRFPTLESAGIRDLVCFYDEKVEVKIEGAGEGK